MYSVTEARQRILSNFQATVEETLPLAECVGRILAVALAAPVDLPRFDNSSMDGFALRAEDASLLTLRVVADIPAGSAPDVTLARGQAARIMTGAQIPAGANAVIPVEDTDFNFDRAGTAAPDSITFTKKIEAGENIRLRGTDLHTGEIVLQPGRKLKPQDLGLLAMLGIARVTVHKKPCIALLSSGNELVDVNEPLPAGMIYDSNSYALGSLIQSAGAHVLQLGIAKDTHAAVADLLQKAVAKNVDLIITSAGVSVGAFDFVKEVIESNGRLDFWRVNMRPGKPLAFGEYQNIPIIGLPGNPVSAFVGFEVFVRPVLEKLGGLLDEGRRTVKVSCAQEIESDGRESYLRAKIRSQHGALIAELTGHQGSGNLLSMVQADALLIIPAGVKCVPVGREVEAYLL